MTGAFLIATVFLCGIGRGWCAAGAPPAASGSAAVIPRIDQPPGIQISPPPPGPVKAGPDASDASVLIGGGPGQPRLLLHFWMSEWVTNTYVLIGQRHDAIVIDPADWMLPAPNGGWRLSGTQSSQLVAAIRARKLNVRLIICTHGHLDHVSGLPALKAAFPHCKICMAPGDIDADGKPKDSHMFPGGLTRVDDRLRDGQEINCAGIRLKVIFTPGHSPGSLCLLCGDWLFSGDTLFKGTVGRTNFLDGSGNWDHEIASIRTRLYTLPPATLVLPGHDDFTTIGEEKAHNPFTSATAGSAPPG